MPSKKVRRPIPGLSGYAADAGGSVWSSRRGKTWRRLKDWRHAGGYRQIELAGQNYFVHQLVLLAFVGPCPPGLECRHLDDNPRNNRIDNLAYGTHKENGSDYSQNHAKRRKMALQE